MRVKLGDVCERGTSNLKLSDVSEKNGEFSVFGASGYIGSVDFYQQGYPYVAVVKDGAGIGRAMLCPGKTSVIGTMQYLLPKDNILPKYLFYVVKYMNLEKYFTGATIPHIYFKDYKNEEFNFDFWERQVEIVSVLSKCEEGNFDNVKACGYAIPSHWDIGKVYKRLIKGVADREKTGVIDALFHVYNSFVSAKIDDYNSSMYYENPSYLLECYLENRVIE